MPNINPEPDVVQRVINFFYKSYSSDVGLITGFNLSESKVKVGTPLEIKDLDGGLLFNDYDIVDRDGAKIGTVRSSARGSELPIIDAIMIGKQMFEPGPAKDAILGAATGDYSGGDFEVIDFVCYGYPRVGILLKGRHEGREFHVIYDAHLARRVSEFDPSDVIRAPGEESGREGGEALEGDPIYSYAANLPEAGPEDLFAQEWLNMFKVATNFVGNPIFEAQSLATVSHSLFDEAASVLENSATEPSAPQPAMQGVTLPIPLIGQETPVFCAVATGKMILEYLGFKGFTQTQIAEAFQTGPRGTTNPKMILGLKQLTQNKWIPAIDMTPTMEEGFKYLRSYLPGKSGVPGHARLLRGWREYAYLNPQTRKPDLLTAFYLVNDPYPTLAGQYVMEAVKKPIDDFYRNLVTVSTG